MEQEDQINESSLYEEETTIIQIPKKFHSAFVHWLKKKNCLSKSFSMMVDDNPINESLYFEWKHFQEENFVPVEVPLDTLTKRRKVFIFAGQSQIVEDIEKTFQKSFQIDSCKLYTVYAAYQNEGSIEWLPYEKKNIASNNQQQQQQVKKSRLILIYELEKPKQCKFEFYQVPYILNGVKNASWLTKVESFLNIRIENVESVFYKEDFITSPGLSESEKTIGNENFKPTASLEETSDIVVYSEDLKSDKSLRRKSRKKLQKKSKIGLDTALELENLEQEFEEEDLEKREMDAGERRRKKKKKMKEEEKREQNFPLNNTNCQPNNIYPAHVKASLLAKDPFDDDDDDDDDDEDDNDNDIDVKLRAQIKELLVGGENNEELLDCQIVASVVQRQNELAKQLLHPELELNNINIARKDQQRQKKLQFYIYILQKTLLDSSYIINLRESQKIQSLGDSFEKNKSLLTIMEPAFDFNNKNVINAVKEDQEALYE